MSLRRLLIAYLVTLHAALAALVWTVLRPTPAWLFAAEAGLVMSVIAGSWLVTRLLRATTLIRESALLLEESDYTTRFRLTGHEEIDRLIDIYNRMVDALRGERIRVREQHHFLQRILDVSPSGAIVLDHDGRIELLNPAAARLVGPRVQRGEPATAEGTPLADIMRSLSSDHTAMVTLPGARRAKASRGSFMDRGFPRTFVLIEELTDELRHAEKAAYEKLIRMLSHEVNNSVAASNSLLTSCLAYTHQLPQESGEDLANALQVVVTRTAQLGAFMKSFADVVRLPEPRRARCDVAGLLQQLQQLMAGEADRRRIRWQLDLQSIPEVLLDRVLMEQAIVNILKNAMEAIGTDGVVTLRTAMAGGRAQFSIEDTGPGLAPEVRAHLFTPFFSTKEAGQGIGLTLVQEILMRHGFDFSLDSAVGGPTCFTVELGERRTTSSDR